MEDTLKNVEKLTGILKEYLNVKIDTVKLGVAEKGAIVTGKLLTTAVIVFVFMFGFLLINFSLAYALSDWMGYSWSGFLVLSICYFLLAIIICLFRKKLLQISFTNFIVKLIFNNEPDGND